MKLTVLGCNGPFPAPNGACSGYLLEAEGARVLIDCGTGVLARLTSLMPPETLDAVVLSHLHYDHMSDMLPLVYRMQGQTRRLPVYAPTQPAALCALLDGAFEMHDLAAGGQVGTLRLTAFPVRHPVPCFATRFEAEGKAFCYTGDTNTCPGLAEFAADCDLLLVDACFTVAQWGQDKPHLSARLAAELARQAGAHALLLTHFHPDTPAERLLPEAQASYPAVRAAQVGLTAEI